LIGTVSPSRRFTSRVETNGEVWVYWQCGMRVDVSRVRNVSAGGMFLVQEGSIRADAEVRRSMPGEGLGLKFVAVEKECGPHLAELLARLHSIKRERN
jgi:hypothetical protein